MEPCCDAPSVVQSPDGMNVCESCACVLGPVIDTGAEWNHYADDSNRHDPGRCGNPVSEIFASSFGSTHRVVYRKGDANQGLMQSLRSHSSLPGEKALLNVYSRIENVLSIYGQSRGVIREAQAMYTALHNEYTTRGSSRDSQIANAVKLAFDQLDFPKSLDEISDMFMIDKHQTIKGAKRATKVAHQMGVQQKDVTPFDLVAHMAKELALSEEQTKICHFVTWKWDKLKLEAQNTPHTIVGALVFMTLVSMGVIRRRDDVAHAAGLKCSLSLEKCLKKIMVHRDKLLEGVPIAATPALPAGECAVPTLPEPKVRRRRAPLIMPEPEVKPEVKPEVTPNHRGKVVRRRRAPLELPPPSSPGSGDASDC